MEDHPDLPWLGSPLVVIRLWAPPSVFRVGDLVIPRVPITP